MTDEDAVWNRVLALMPPCETCGERVEPGGAGGQHVLVCRACSTVTTVDPVWVTTIVNRAREEM